MFCPSALKSIQNFKPYFLIAQPFKMDWFLPANTMRKADILSWIIFSEDRLNNLPVLSDFYLPHWKVAPVRPESWWFWNWWGHNLMTSAGRVHNFYYVNPWNSMNIQLMVIMSLFHFKVFNVALAIIELEYLKKIGEFDHVILHIFS